MSGPGHLAGVEGHLAELHPDCKGSRDFRAQALFSLLRHRYLPKTPGDCLDVGCGDGAISVKLAEAGWSITGLDPSARLIALAIRRFRTAGYRAHFHVAPAVEAPMSGQFDLVICLDVLEHIEDDLGALRAIYAATRAGGIAVFNVPALQGIYNVRDRQLGHYRRYEKREIIDKLSSVGYEVRACTFWNLIGLLPYWFYAKVLHREVYDGLRKGPDSLLKRMIRGILVRLLQTEARMRLPFGLSLVAVGRRPAS